MNKTRLLMFVLVLVTFAITIPTSAHRWERNQSDNVLQLVGWAVHPIGVGLEYAIFRPAHWLVSQDDLDIVFGHEVYLSDEKYFFEWVHGDYEPSIKEERMRAHPQRYQETSNDQESMNNQESAGK